MIASLKLSEDLDLHEVHKKEIQVQLFYLAPNVAQIIFNKPQKLNALDLESIILLRKYIKDLNNNWNVKIVIIGDDNGNSFCAGTDVKAIYHSLTNPSEEFPQNLPEDQSAAEYKMINELHHMQQLTICIMDGYAMGLGYGIANSCKVRIVTEKTIFSMPECRIGMVPDVGAGLFLSRLPSNIGLYIGLTGKRLNGFDMINLKMADYYVPHESVHGLIHDIIRLPEINIEKTFIIEIIQSYWKLEEIPKLSFEDETEVISFYFESDSMKAIFNMLLAREKFPDQAQKILEELLFQCPMALCLFLELYRRNKQGTIDLTDNLVLDYRLFLRIKDRQDLIEGIRSALITKSFNAQWNPPSIYQIDEKEIVKYFHPLENGELQFYD